MADAETVLKVPDVPGPILVTRGKDSYKVTRQDAASWLLAKGDMTGLSQQWIDMLGGLGLALKLDGDGRIWTIISRPAERIVANCGTYGGKYEDVPLTFPARTWVLSWRNEKLASSGVYVSERPILSLRDQAHLLCFPYGNADRGGICWGSAATSHLSVKNPLEVETLFFRSGLNEHLFQAPWLGTSSLKAWGKKHPDTPLPLEMGTRGQTIQQILNLGEQ